MDFLDSLDLQKFYYRLRIAKGPIDQLTKRNDEIIKEETEQLLVFLNTIKDMTTKKLINEQECIKIYEFENSDNDLLGDEAFLTPSNEVVYQVYDEYAYKGIVPESEVISGFAYMNLDFFLKNRTLEDIVSYFVNEPEMLNVYKTNLEKENERRAKFLESFSSVLKNR